MRSYSKPNPVKAPPSLVEITDVGFGGKGVGRVDGKVWFVPFVISGEKIQATPRRIKKDFVEAEFKSVESASPDRVAPLCDYFTKCGGCSYQHINYDAQLAIKQRQVESLVRRVAKLEGKVEAVRPSPDPYFYRNRITLHIREGQAGFIGADPTRFVPIKRCVIASEAVNEKLDGLLKRRLRDGHITLRDHDPAQGFRQTNNAAAEILLELVKHFAGSGERLVDAFCGSGFFSRALRDNFNAVVGIDWSVPAIESARELAQEKETYFLGDALENLREVLADSDVLVLDPPTEGLVVEVTDLVVERRPQRVIYVSCNPATLSRDLARLSAVYEVERIVPVDMFPQTAEIECVASLIRK